MLAWDKSQLQQNTQQPRWEECALELRKVSMDMVCHGC